MNPERLLQYFERISEAEDAVPRLRRFILDLAVRGRLVEQDPGEEPEAELLKLVHKGITRDTAPTGWIRGPFGSLLEMRYGKGLPARERKKQGKVPVFGSNGIVGFTDTALTDKSSIIVGRKGSAGAINLCDGPSWTTDVAYFIIPPDYFNIDFLFFALETLNLGNLGKGVKPGLSRSDANQLSLVVPPLAEQHRIVAKVDELMTLCDELEAAQAKRETQRDRLVAATLHGLNNGEGTFQENTRFYFNHLPRLTTRPEHIQQLRQTIRNLAIQAKLTTRHSGEECAHELLEKIIDRKQVLQADRTVRKMKNLEPITELPWKVPENWIWTRLGQLCYTLADGPHFSPNYVKSNEGVPFISAGNIRIDSFDLKQVKYVSPKDHSEFCKRVKPEPGDVLYTKGGTTGVAKVNDLDFEFSVWVHVAVLKIAKEFLEPEYVALALNSPHCYAQSQEFTHGTSNRDLGLTRMIKITIPLPPLAEQHRIVAKVDELMALCDELETRLTSAATTRRQLLEATLHEAFAVGD